jgi:integrase
MVNLAAKNSSGAGMDSFIFWAEKTPGKPMENRLYLNGLRDALQKTGMSRDVAKVYTFHGWRHFYTSYMRDRVTEKLLQSQTGHKSIKMLDHYSDHRTVGDREKIQAAQREVFKELIPEAAYG